MMSTIIFCPQGHTVTLDDPAPRDVACPRCGIVFSTRDRADESSGPRTLSAGLAVRAARGRDEDDEDEEDDRPRRRKKRRPEPEEEEDFDDEPVSAVRLTRKQKQMSMVRLGILFHSFKLWSYLTALALFLITMPLVLFLAAFGGGFLATLLWQFIFNLGMTLAPLFGIVGSILCAYVPPKSEARGTIIVSLLFDLLAPFFGILQLIMFFAYAGTNDERVARLIDYMLLGRLACTVIAWWLFQLYLRKLSFYMRESLLASEALNVIVHLLVATVASPTLVTATFVVAIFFGGLVTIIAFFMTLGWFIYFFITFPFRQFRLLSNVRSRIYDKYLKPDDD